ncbi:GyrI-like domain-containing protein [Ascidiimonas aurantiaca]|uniref:GyrI-like domain-containing protein n=1 Tax=Ascidiimonas aurantiaca TaxID=1685432 RepID=UPI0030EB1424
MEVMKGFKIVGITIKTTNQDGKAAEDLGKLWEQFYSQDISGKILNKKSDAIYSVYTDYESDYTGKYTCIIGLCVESLEQIPDGLTGREFESGEYRKFIAKGQMPKAVSETWQEIWKKDKELNRTYTADFEIYGHRSQNGENAEIDIYIATKQENSNISKHTHTVN